MAPLGHRDDRGGAPATDPLRPPDTDEEPWSVVDMGLDRHRSRDIALACFAGIVILVLLAWVAAR